MEYGFSCMGYEIAGAMGIKMAQPERDVICFTGDGTYMMANSELATAVMMGIDFTIVVTDNRGYGCINRLQMGCGGAEFNNLLDHTIHQNPSAINFAQHAASMGAKSAHVSSINELEEELATRKEPGVKVIVIDTDPYPSTEAGGYWWDVAVPEVSEREEVQQAREAYLRSLAARN
jgi:3D-(3,5/4)-trihydroxycyclohexane-1,2-dione acylhydrolase (decyclizing)